jgi:hypothetical protein
MAYGEVGGNGSVEWMIEVESPKWTQSQGKLPKGHRQAGADDGGRPGQYFTLRIELPKDPAERTKLANGLQQAAADASTGAGGAKVEFALVIEHQNRDQIQIAWPDD